MIWPHPFFIHHRTPGEGAMVPLHWLSNANIDADIRLTGVRQHNGRRFAGTDIIFDEFLKNADVHVSHVTRHRTHTAQWQAELQQYTQSGSTEGATWLTVITDGPHKT